MNALSAQASVLVTRAALVHKNTVAQAEIFGRAYLSLPRIFSRAVAKAVELHIASEQEVRFLLLLLLAYVFAFVYRCLPSARWRHLLSVYGGALLGQNFCGATGWLYPLTAALVSFQLMHLMGPSRAAPIVFAFNLIFLFSLHLHRQLTDPFGWHLDATFMQMIVTQKLSSLAWSVSDGSPKSLSTGLSRARAEFAVREIPLLLETLAYAFFPPCFLMGPAFEYMDWYRNAHDLAPALQLNNAGSNESGAQVPEMRRPNILELSVASLARFLQAALLLLCFQLANMKLPSDLLADQNWLLRNRAEGLWRLYLRIWLSLLGLRCKYYFGFKISEGAAILSGIGFSGYVDSVEPNSGDPGTRPPAIVRTRKPRPRFDRVRTIDILAFELAGSLKDAAAAWNKPTNTWLRRCVYERLPRKYQLDLYGTYVVSAIWHGIAPGYYMFFVTSAFLTSLEREWRRLFRSLGLAQKLQRNRLSAAVVRVITLVWTSATLNYFIISFVMLTRDRTLRVWSALSYWGHKMLLLDLLVLLVARILVSCLGASARKERSQLRA
jgi:lysophospholipid acyltransferase